MVYPVKQRIQVAGREQEFLNVVGSYSRVSETLRGRERKILRERSVHAAASVVVTVAEMGQVLRERRYVSKYARKVLGETFELVHDTGTAENSS
jgi:hypothetical protein